MSNTLNGQWRESQQVCTPNAVSRGLVQFDILKFFTAINFKVRAQRETKVLYFGSVLLWHWGAGEGGLWWLAVLFPLSLVEEVRALKQANTDFVVLCMQFYVIGFIMTSCVYMRILKSCCVWSCWVCPKSSSWACLLVLLARFFFSLKTVGAKTCLCSQILIKLSKIRRTIWIQCSKREFRIFNLISSSHLPNCTGGKMGRWKEYTNLERALKNWQLGWLEIQCINKNMKAMVLPLS